MGLSDYTVLTRDDKNVVNTIDQAILKSTNVYIYRKFKDVTNENITREWFMNEAVEKIDTIEIIEDSGNKKVVIEAINNEYIYGMKLDDYNRNSFKNSFKISLRHVENTCAAMENRLGRSKYFIDDPAYEQYDLIFEAQEKMLLMIETHTFYFVVSKELLYDK